MDELRNFTQQLYAELNLSDAQFQEWLTNIWNLRIVL
jgi:hypothetical protein